MAAVETHDMHDVNYRSDTRSLHFQTILHGQVYDGEWRQDLFVMKHHIVHTCRERQTEVALVYSS